MRIALVTREYPPETAWGGIGRFYASFASALASEGHEIEVFTQGLAADGTEESGGIMVHRVIPRKWLIGPRQGGDLAGMGGKGIGIFALSLAVAMAGRVALRHKAKPFDIVEGHDHLGINALLNIFGKHRFSSITRYHTTYHSLVSRDLVDWPRSRLISWLEEISLRSADARISASAYVERMTRADFPSVPECDAVIPLLSDHLVSAENSPYAQRDKLAIFVGRLMPGHKSPDLAATAFAQLAEQFPDWRIEFAGSDMPAKDGGTCWETCERILARFPGRYLYHGPLGQRALRDLYDRARIIVIPSRFESFGLVALEAMTAGVVPVVSDDTALPEVVGECGLVFRCGSSDDLRSKLKQIMRDEASQLAHSKAGQQRVLRSFSREQVLAQNSRFFEALPASRQTEGHPRSRLKTWALGKFEARIVKYANEPANQERFARLLNRILPKYTEWTWGRDGIYRRHFNSWQASGFNLTPNHYYSPIPDVHLLTSADLTQKFMMTGVDLRESSQLELLKTFKQFQAEYSRFDGKTGDPQRFHFNNGVFESCDAEILHCFVRQSKPKRLIEVGSGFSTLVTAAACEENRIRDGVACEFTAIEPYPNDLFQNPIPGLSRVIQTRVQDVDLSLFTELGEHDVLFIDSTHVLKAGSDVERLYLEVIPSLKPGVLVHIHDVFFPFPYPRDWLQEEHIFWNEQQFLQAFLAFNTAFEVMWAGAFMHSKHPDELARAFPAYHPSRCLPGSFWMRRSA